MKVETFKKAVMGIVSAYTVVGATAIVDISDEMRMETRLYTNAESALDKAITRAEYRIPDGVCRLPKHIPYQASSLWHSYKGQLTLHIENYAQVTGTNVTNAAPSYQITAENIDPTYSIIAKGPKITSVMSAAGNNLLPGSIYNPATVARGQLSTAGYSRRVTCELA